MEVLTAELETRTDFFKKIGPDIARQMSEALQKLTAEDIKIEFSSVETFEQNAIFVKTDEKCFGSYVRFKSPKTISALGEGNLEGIVVAVFPLSSTRVLTGLLLKRYFKETSRERVDDKLKLSAFKEAVNILLLPYITEVANALKIKIETSRPEFASFSNIELSKPDLLKNDLSCDSLVSVGQFNIRSCDMNASAGQAEHSRESSSSPVKGRFIVVY